MAKQSVYLISLSAIQFEILVECQHQYQVRHRRFVSFPSMIKGILKENASGKYTDWLAEGAVGIAQGHTEVRLTLRLTDNDQALFSIFRKTCTAALGKEVKAGASLALLAFCYLRMIDD